MKQIATILLAVMLGVTFVPDASACAACFGRTDSPLAAGMNAGIFSLLFVVILVLGGVASFFIYLVRRANQTVASASQQPPSETLQSN